MDMTANVGPLFTDLYELTMAASYFQHKIHGEATFSLYVRRLPASRNFLVAAGLEDVLTELEALRFAHEDIAYLEKCGLFSDAFLSYLHTFRFSGQVLALPEGTVFFADEPILEVSAPIMEAQILETYLLNTIGFQSLIASKAARCVHAARGRALIDFSLRRTHEKTAGMKVARSTYLAGFDMTSNVLAGKIYDIPVSGTMAHSYITAFASEREAFGAYAETFPQNSVFLIDTFDTLAGARIAAKVAQEMRRKGAALIGVRLDSGDMVDLSQKVRGILDEFGLRDVKIFASGGFDEYKIADVLARGARIDAFGVGTKVGVSADAPYFDIVYKLVRYGGRNVRKLSPGKITLAGKKQVFRRCDRDGRYLEDIIGTRDEHVDNSRPLLETVMENGRRLRPSPTLQAARNSFRANFAKLPETCKALQGREPFPVKISARLSALQKETTPPDEN